MSARRAARGGRASALGLPVDEPAGGPRDALVNPAARSRRRLLVTMLAPLAAGLPQACGFTLRKSADLPFATVYNALPPGSGLAVEFMRQIRAAGGTTLVTNRQDAQATVLLEAETRDKEAVSFSPSGRPREYELRYRAVFRVLDRSGVEVMRPTEIVLRRYITTTDVELLAEQLEEDFLYREMQSDMVQQLMRRLAAIEPVA